MAAGLRKAYWNDVSVGKCRSVAMELSSGIVIVV